MELFSLLAKLVLDTKEYEREVQRVENQKVTVQDPSIGLDRAEFDNEIADIPTTDVGDIEDNPDIGLDREPFDTEVADIPGTDVGDIENDPDVGLDHTEFDEGVADVKEAEQTFSEESVEMFDSIKKALVATGIVAAISGITNMITNAINKTTEMADTIDKQSTRLGISRQKYQEWDHALKQSGGSVEELSRGAVKFNGIIADTNALLSDESNGFSLVGKTLDGQLETLKEAGVLTEEQANAFRQLNISLIDSNGNLKTSEQLMEEVLMATADLRPEEQLNIINDLFGRNVTGIVNLVSQGKSEVKELLGEADELGLVMSDDEISNAVAYGDAVANLQAELEAVRAEFVSGIIPVLTDAVKMITAIVAFFNPDASKNSLSEKIKDSDEELGQTLADIEATSAVAGDMIDKLFSMGDATKLTAKEQAEWKATAEWLVTNIPSLSKVIDLDTMSINENREGIESNLKAWKELARERAVYSALEEQEAMISKQLGEAYDKSAEASIRQIEADQALVEAKAGINDELDKELEYMNKMADEADKRLDSATAEYYRNEASRLEQMRLTAESGEKELLALQSELQLKHINRSDYAGSTRIGAVASEYRELKMEAESLQKEADKLEAEAESALEEYTKKADYMKQSLLEAQEETKNLTALLDQIQNEKLIHVKVVQDNVQMFKQAKGDWSVPYDNYPSLLHRDEMVLTATQARRYRQGDGNNNIDTNALAQAIGESIRSNMQGVTVRSYINGREVTEEVNRNQIKELKARRFSR